MRYTNPDNINRAQARRCCLIVFALFAALMLSGPVMAQTLDICGCEGHPNSLGNFNSADEATYPPGTTSFGRNSPEFDTVIVIPLPDDGVLIFDSIVLDKDPNGRKVSLFFGRNPANTPVTLLVAGDFSVLGENGFQGARIFVSGNNGGRGSSDIAGVGSLGGPGGFRGGDGAYQLINFQGDGGAGLGPAGGNGATVSPPVEAAEGSFVGIAELLPMNGGSGGGGGRSTSADLSCSAGGGGGGGGALLIAVNGQLLINGQIIADGGRGGSRGSSVCATVGSWGSGGAVRVLADTIAGSGNINARGDGGSFTRSPGKIRLEAFNNSLPGSNTNPVASRVPAPGPLLNPLTPSVAITAVLGETVSLDNGALLAELPQGGYGKVDVLLPTPGVVDVDLATSNVPVGTTVDVTIKPSPGGLPLTVQAILDALNCDAAGACTAQVSVDLAAGKYIIEAQATFQTP